MKKLIALLCLLAICLPLCACGGSGLEAVEETKTEAKTEEAVETGPITYPDTFAVGYAIGDITCTTPLTMYNAVADRIHDPLMLTVTAFSDGEGNVALVMSADLKGMHRPVFERTTKIIEEKFGIKPENVILSCTHTHSAPTVGESNAEVNRWAPIYYKTFPAIVEKALRDLDPLEGAYIGKSVAEGISFVRRYLLADGTYKMNPGSSDNPVEHESVADPELRTIRFDRKNKKDVLMVNYQTHYGGATNKYPKQLSADFVYPFRKQAQKKWDCLFAYQSGAGGDVNFNSLIPGEKIYADYEAAIAGFMSATEAALKSEEKAEIGTIKTAGAFSVATVKKDSKERLSHARSCAALEEGEQLTRLLKEYGFSTKYEPGMVIKRNTEMGDTENVPLSCITFGDIAFAAFPYEMVHENGRQCREASPFKMTFINSLAGGGYGYIPTKEAFPHGGYEVGVCRYTEGCGEMFVADMVKLLNQCKTGA